MNVTPYLTFNGNCREAFEFYAACLGTEVKAMMTGADVPADAAMGDSDDGCAGGPPPADKVIHACIEFENSQLMASDWMSPEPFQPPKGFSVALGVDSVAEAERVFKALSEGGQVQMPLGETFFAAAFGMLVDKFGVSWMVNCDKHG